MVIVPLMGLIPFGLTNFRQAMNNTVQSGIVQSLTNDILLTDFANLKTMAGSQGKFYYFDADGAPLGTAQGAFYTAQISFTDLSPGASAPTSPLASLNTFAGTKALITITKFDKTKDYFSVVIGNNRSLAENSPEATW